MNIVLGVFFCGWVGYKYFVENIFKVNFIDLRFESRFYGM